MSSKVIVWGQPRCTYCDIAKRLLEDASIAYEYKQLVDMDSKAEFFEETNGARSVPQILIDGRLLGGLEELKVYLNDNN